MTEVQVAEYPLSWEAVVEAVQTDNLPRLRRSRSQQNSMEAFAQAIRQEWVSTSDYIYASKFSLATEMDGGKRRVPEASLATAGVQQILVPNDFPYYFAPGIRHFVLWKINGDVTSVDMEQAQAELQRHHGASEIQSFINPPSLKV